MAKIKKLDVKLRRFPSTLALKKGKNAVKKFKVTLLDGLREDDHNFYREVYVEFNLKSCNAWLVQQKQSSVVSITCQNMDDFAWLGSISFFSELPNLFNAYK